MATSSSQMTTVNPKIDRTHKSVPDLIRGLRRDSKTKITIKGSLEVPDWWGLTAHLQGLAPYNGFSASIANGCLAGSSDSGYIATFSQDPEKSSAHVQQVVIPDKQYGHAAGIQLLGDYLPVPLEGGGQNAKVICYDVSTMSKCVPLHSVTFPGEKASAVAITSYASLQGERALLGVYEYTHHSMYWFTAKPEDLSIEVAWPWEPRGGYKGDALQGDQFQCFSLITETAPRGTDLVYLAGFREDEELHLFTVNTNDDDGFGTLQLVEVYKGWSGTDWRFGGVALQIVDANTLRLLATSKDPSGDRHGDYEIDLFAWE